MAKLPFKWAVDAETNYYETIDYILSRFGVDAAIKFVDKVDSVIELIRINSALFPLATENVHRCVISYQSSLTYTMDNGVIYISSFYTNRSNHTFYMEEGED